MRRQNLNEQQYDAIDWDALAGISSKWYWGKSRFLSKSMAGIAPTGRFMFRHKEWPHDKCP